MNTAQVQAECDAADLANHRARLLWLEGDSPKWADGTNVDAHTRHALIVLSRAAIAKATGDKS